MFLEHTPIERHTLNGHTVFVKRDDLYGQPPAPPLAKLRGARRLLERLYREDVRLVGTWDTPVSRLGHGIAAVCSTMPGMHCIVSYPTARNRPIPEGAQIAERLGATVLPVRGGRISISFAAARSGVIARGGTMLPFGLECDDAVEGVAEEALRTPHEYLQNGTLVVTCGSGVTLAGLLRGLPQLPARIVGLSSGRSLRMIERTVRRYAPLPDNLSLNEASEKYSTATENDCPFPAHPNYDRKTWAFLSERIHRYNQPILFWNIGA